MIHIHLPGGVVADISTTRVTVENGMLAVVRSKEDLEHLVRLGALMRTGGRKRLTYVPGNGDDIADMRLRDLAAALLLGDRADEVMHGNISTPSPSNLRAEDAYDALLIGLMAIADLWPGDDGRDQEGALALCLALTMPGGAGEAAEVSLRLTQPQAALWITPGSVIAGLSVGTAIKAARWCALVVSTIRSASADAAARTLIEDLRNKAAKTSAYSSMPRLDALNEAERTLLRQRPVIVVFLHGLFGTDLGTFDGFITRLREASIADLVESLTLLAASAPGALVRAHLGVDKLCDSLRRIANPNGSDLRVAQFIDEHVGLVGWPHDSLAPVDTCATELAALLKKEFSSEPPKHIVFVCHSQGGLLARATAVELASMKAPAARWLHRVAAIATFGTPHYGAAIAEPGGKGGREMALYLMMLSGTGKPSSLLDVLAIAGERTIEGIEDVKAFNASTPERERSFVRDLLRDELRTEWPNDANRPAMLLVGGRLEDAQRATWRDRVAAKFVSHKLRHDNHDLVVEVSSSTMPVIDPIVSITVASDHFSYFAREGESALALDAAVALIWTMLGDHIDSWRKSLEGTDTPERVMPSITLRRQFPK